jgi:hypothetical protein
MAGQTVREDLLAVALGDLGELIGKVEALKASLPAEAEAMVERMLQGSQAATRGVEATLRQAHAEAEGQRRAWLAAALEVAREIKDAAVVASGSSRKLAMWALAIGAAAGAVGGALAALVVIMM